MDAMSEQTDDSERRVSASDIGLLIAAGKALAFGRAVYWLRLNGFSEAGDALHEWVRAEQFDVAPPFPGKEGP